MSRSTTGVTAVAAASGMNKDPTPPATTVVTTETLRDRLVTREGGGAKISPRGSLARCTLRYRDLFQAVTSCRVAHSSLDASDLRGIADALKRELMLHRLETGKLSLVADSAEAEILEYDAAQRDIDASVRSAREEIEQLKARLVRERQVRRDKEEYEALARMANRRPSRRSTKRKLDAVRGEMERIRADEVRTGRELEGREKQFQLLLQCIFDLKSGLAEDAEEEDFRREALERLEQEDEEEEDEEDGEETEDLENGAKHKDMGDGVKIRGEAMDTS